MIEEVVSKKLATMSYDPASAKGWAETIVDTVKERVKKELSVPSYKIVVQCVIGDLKG